jgi:hypothetical protein
VLGRFCDWNAPGQSYLQGSVEDARVIGRALSAAEVAAAAALGPWAQFTNNGGSTWRG